MNTYQAPEILEIGLAQDVIQGVGVPLDEPEAPFLQIEGLIDAE
jgi:hypothetical protein